MRIGFVTDDFVQFGPGDPMIPGGCAYYRCMLPKNTAGPLSAFGRPAWTGQLGFGARLGKDQAVFGFDTVMLKMLMDRWVPKQMRIAQDLGQRLIVDVDDAYDHLHPANQAYWATSPERNKVRNREHYRAVIEQADVVTVTTPFLREYYQSLGIRDVRMIRNGINPKQFDRRPVTNTKPVIGWPGALRWRSNDVDTAIPWLNEFLEQHDLKFHHAGHMPDTVPFAEIAGINSDRMILSGMQQINHYQHMLDFDIGIVLLSDIPFNEAKSTIKGLEMAAKGIPFVAQDLPEYRLLAEQGVGRVASTPEEWIKHLTELLDYETRKQEAARQRELVLREHSIVARAPEWVDLFMEGKDQITDIPSVRIPYRSV